MKCNLSIFSFVTYVSYLRDSCIIQVHEDFHLCSPLRIFLALALTFRSWVHFELFFAYSRKYGSTFIFLHADINYPHTICWEDYSFPIGLSWHSCQKFINHKCMGLFIDSYSISLISMSINMTEPYCFDYYWFIVSFEIRKHECVLLLVFYFKIILSILYPLHFYMNFSIGWFLA